MKRLRGSWRTGLRVVLLLGAGLAAWTAGAAGPAPAQPAPLVLDQARREIDPWPALTVWLDPDHGGEAAALAAWRAQRFSVPDAPRHSFGARNGTLWLQLPLRQQAGADAPPWWLRIGYPDLDRIDLLVLDADGTVLDRQVMGHELRCAERPLCASAHAAPLRLRPGQDHTVLLGVRTHSEHLVPLRLLRDDAFHQAERRSHLAAGLELGFAGAVLLFALSHWWSLRRGEFGLIALVVVAAGASLLWHSGIGEKYLWPEQIWLMQRAGLMAAAWATAASCLLLHHVLDAERVHRGGARLLRATAVAAPLLLLAPLTGLWPDRVTNALLALLVAVPTVAGLALARKAWRQGQRHARLVFAERLLQGTGTVVFVAMLHGVLPAHPLTQHSFVVSALGSFVVYCLIIVRRVEAARAGMLKAELRREQLSAQAEVDALTGLPNRRALRSRLEVALPACSAQQPLALFLIDLDGFKPINDQHGHAVGDALLVAVAQRLRGLLRADDLLARLGGDEFVVVAPVGNAAAAWRLGAQLLQEGARPYPLDGLTARVGLTIGWTWADRGDHDLDALLAAADAALYDGKRQGRGRLVAADGVPPAPAEPAPAREVRA